MSGTENNVDFLSQLGFLPTKQNSPVYNNYGQSQNSLGNMGVYSNYPNRINAGDYIKGNSSQSNGWGLGDLGKKFGLVNDNGDLLGLSEGAWKGAGTLAGIGQSIWSGIQSQNQYKLLKDDYEFNKNMKLKQMAMVDKELDRINKGRATNSANFKAPMQEG